MAIRWYLSTVIENQITKCGRIMNNNIRYELIMNVNYLIFVLTYLKRI